jgi:Type IV secretion system pilin
MIKKIKTFTFSLMATLGLVLNLAVPMALAQNIAPACDTSGSGASCAPTSALNCGTTGDFTGKNCAATGDADTKINKTVKLAIQLFQILVGLISVFMLISAGLKYITSGGDSAGVGAAKNMILYAAVGLVVVALSQVIVQFVLNRVNTTTQL